MKLVEKVKAAIVRRLSVREPEGWTPSSQQSDAGELVNESSTMALSAVWACTNLIAGTIGTLPLLVYRMNGDVQTEARDHPLFRLLHESPNFDQTSVDFWEFMSASLELWGNAFALKARTSGKTSGLTPIRPDIVSVRRLSQGTLEYTWTDEGKFHRHDDTEILHIRGFGGSPLGGMSTLHFGRHAFGLARAVDRAAGNTFRNGMRPSGALVFKEFLSEENRATAENRLTEKFVGAQNAGRPMILEGGTEWTQLTINPEDAQMLESRRFSVEEICRFFGVPPVMIGHMEKNSSWPSSVESQAILLQKFTLRRRLKRIEQALMKQLLTPADRANGIFIKFNVDGLLRGDSAARSAFYQTMSQLGAMTINEIRALENLPPIEGGDIPRIQMQNIPITEANNEPTG